MVPLLQERGVFRTEYEGTTLRDHLGLTHPDTPRAVRADPSAQWRPVAVRQDTDPVPTDH